jgi:nitrogen fixation NifU-like protein
MSDLRELYQQVILDHYKKPRNFQKLPEANRQAEGHNPLCGDEITVYLQMDGDVIKGISFQGPGFGVPGVPRRLGAGFQGMRATDGRDGD